MIEELKPLLGTCRISGEHAGVHLLLHFQNNETEEELIRLAEEEGIRVYGMKDYRIRQEAKGEATILLGYANLTETQIREAARLLIRCWKEKK